MRIAFHVPRASHLKPGFSGDKILVRGLIEGLRKRGHEVEIVSQLNVRNLWRGRVSPDELRREKDRVRQEMERFVPEAWLVYGTSTTNPDLFGWQLASQNSSLRPKYLLLATDLGTGKRVPEPWRQHFAHAHRQALARCDDLSAYHPSSRDDLIRFGIPEQRISLLPPAVCLHRQQISKNEARQCLEICSKAPILLCASRFPHPEEGGSGKVKMLFDLVASSTSLPPEAVLVIAGDGPGKPAIEEAIASVPRRCSIRLVGAIEHEKMALYFAACDFFVYPNRIDRPWLAVLEAQSCGRPVVTLQSRSAELTVQTGRTGLVASDLNEFRQAIASLANNHRLCREMGLAAAQYVAECHSLEKRINQIENMLEAAGPESCQAFPNPTIPASIFSHVKRR